MEIAIWQNFNHSEVLFYAISNTNNQNIIDNFVEENSLTYPILFDPGSPGGVHGGNTYDLYFMPNDGSPYPRDFIINQEGIIAYANNEIDTAWMISVIENLLSSNNDFLGDINQDSIINVLDVVSLINFILLNDFPNEEEFWTSDINQDNQINVLDVVLLVSLILN